MFPGAVRIDLAKMFDTAFARLRDATRLIVDLRGNTGGGIGGLRLMRYLTPGKTDVGYSLTRRASPCLFAGNFQPFALVSIHLVI